MQTCVKHPSEAATHSILRDGRRAPICSACVVALQNDAMRLEAMRAFRRLDLKPIRQEPETVRQIKVKG